jgi:hypothetical protein
MGIILEDHQAMTLINVAVLGVGRAHDDFLMIITARNQIRWGPYDLSGSSSPPNQHSSGLFLGQASSLQRNALETTM